MAKTVPPMRASSPVQRDSLTESNCETMVRLNFDLAHQSALMLNNQDVIFTIHRNSDSFLLLTPPGKKTDGTFAGKTAKEYRIRVHDLRLYSSVGVKTSAKYPLRKIEMRSIFLGKGRTELAHNVFTSTLPRRLICCFGLYRRLFWQPKVVTLQNLNTQITPYLLSFDAAQQRFVRAFVDMYAGLGLDDSDTKTVSIGMQTLPQRMGLLRNPDDLHVG
ncbi:hypothetical protein niasHS_013866 [Heterodera schachtii]|uniref:Uncharacterized protein n=1 Tax=Heterodera schachtii TaxID=97005 RepID=A0ABD2IJ79_HETSC